MISPLEMKKTIKEVYYEGFKPHFKNILKTQKDLHETLSVQDNEYVSDAIIEAYDSAINIKNNISMFPQSILITINYCDMTGEAQIQAQHYYGKNGKNKLIQDGFVSYVVEYNAREFGTNSHIKKAIHYLMEAYCNQDDDDNENINHLVDCYALVRYYCNDIHVFSRDTTGESYASPSIKESKQIASLDQLMHARFQAKLEFSEEDLNDKCYTNPLNLFQAWKNDYELTETDLQYIQTFNIVIHFSAHIKDFDFFRRSYLCYDESLDGFVHFFKDTSGLINFKTSEESTIYSKVEDINKLISHPKKHDCYKFSLIQKNSIPPEY